MENKFEKIITHNEIQKLSIISDLNLLIIIVPYRINNNILSMDIGLQESRLKLDIVSLYNQCLQYLYKNHFDYYSHNIYSFYKVAPCDFDNYIDFLIFQLESLEKTVLSKMDKNLLYKYLENKKILSEYRENMNDLKEGFTLLHGDLFNGNIIKYNGEYKLIDFEYLQIGKRELELAFLLVWDFFSNKNIVQYSKCIIRRDLNLLFSHGIVNETEKNDIIGFYIPFLFLISCLNVTAGNFYYEESIKYCLKTVEWRI